MIHLAKRLQLLEQLRAKTLSGKNAKQLNMTLFIMMTLTVVTYSANVEYLSRVVATLDSTVSVRKAAGPLTLREWRIHGCWTDLQLLDLLSRSCPQWIPRTDIDPLNLRCWDYTGTASCFEMRAFLKVDAVVQRVAKRQGAGGPSGGAPRSGDPLVTNVKSQKDSIIRDPEVQTW